ncbi:hypothetical protein BP6252_01120 [Coleophoma cylindrospora]|uniref:Uncharacterized protein n=1 Tax=Coleophoma cylindrospora TaxID=1849047 RepID=A0A3D8STJ1_9HELO|nr:hypothetical protein BP6252_01120 [Coleophoma cylindrospora]
MVQRRGDLERAHALLQAAPIDDRSWFEDLQSGAEVLALLLHVHHGGLVMDDLVDGRHGRGRGVRRVRVSVAGGEHGVDRRGDRGATEGREASRDGVEASPAVDYIGSDAGDEDRRPWSGKAKGADRERGSIWRGRKVYKTKAMRASGVERAKRKNELGTARNRSRKKWTRERVTGLLLEEVRDGGRWGYTKLFCPRITDDEDGEAKGWYEEGELSSINPMSYEGAPVHNSVGGGTAGPANRSREGGACGFEGRATTGPVKVKVKVEGRQRRGRGRLHVGRSVVRDEPKGQQLKHTGSFWASGEGHPAGEEVPASWASRISSISARPRRDPGWLGRGERGEGPGRAWGG